jgi:hypothetical protein
MEGRGRKRGVWWSSLLGYRFIYMALFVQVLFYKLLSIINNCIKILLFISFVT